jgi:hypothetical protein
MSFLTFDAEVPPGDVPARAFLAGEHEGLLDLVDPGKRDLRHLCGARFEGAPADEHRLLVVQEDAVAVDDPGVAGPAGADVAGDAAGEFRDIDDQDENAGEGARRGRVGLVDGVLPDRAHETHQQFRRLVRGR